MSEWFAGLSPVVQAGLATLFTWSMTALGAAAVFFFRDLNRRILVAALGFTAGVMMAASFWSLLAPSITISGQMGLIEWLPPLIGFLAGAAVMQIGDWLLPHLHLFGADETAEGIRTDWQRSALLVLAITLHNIPEGLAIGVAFGSVGAGLDASTLGAATALAIGIGLQNCPEERRSPCRCAAKDCREAGASGMGRCPPAEPIAAILGASAVLLMRPVLLCAGVRCGAMMSWSGGSIPESQTGGNADLATLGAIVGFAVMMVLDVALA
jgi:ZIP family zinc transporter